MLRNNIKSLGILVVRKGKAAVGRICRKGRF